MASSPLPSSVAFLFSGPWFSPLTWELRKRYFPGVFFIKKRHQESTDFADLFQILKNPEMYIFRKRTTTVAPENQWLEDEMSWIWARRICRSVNCWFQRDKRNISHMLHVIFTHRIYHKNQPLKANIPCMEHMGIILLMAEIPFPTTWDGARTL